MKPLTKRPLYSHWYTCRSLVYFGLSTVSVLNNYLLHGRYVYLLLYMSVCLSVSNFTLKTTDRIFLKVLSQMYFWTRKSSLHFGSDPDVDSDPVFSKDCL